MKEPAEKATLLLILGNTLLFILKIIIGLISNSIAIISDAINSFTDIIASFVVFVCVKMGRKNADEEHPFGHHRIEPIAGLIVAIFITIVGVEVINLSVKRFIFGEQVFFSWIAVSVLIFAMALKAFMFIYLKNRNKKIRSPAIRASCIDCRNDIFLSGAALLGIVGYHLGYPFLDPIVGVTMGGWIIFSGYEVGKSNIDYLIGKSPGKRAIARIKEKALSVNNVKGLNSVLAHFVGNYVHVEVHIELDKQINLTKAHDIGKNVQKKLENIPWINKAFIHIDPV